MVAALLEGKADPNLMTVTAPPSPVEGVVARPTATPVASDSDETTSAPVATGDDTFVSLQDPSGSGEYIFDEADLTFGVGESVNFVLEAEGEFHTFTVEELGINVAVTAGSTQELSFTFDTAGTYELICVPHKALGMVGTITVQ